MTFCNFFQLKIAHFHSGIPLETKYFISSLDLALILQLFAPPSPSLEPAGLLYSRRLTRFRHSLEAASHATCLHIPCRIRPSLDSTLSSTTSSSFCRLALRPLIGNF